MTNWKEIIEKNYDSIYANCKNAQLTAIKAARSNQAFSAINQVILYSSGEVEISRRPGGDLLGCVFSGDAIVIETYKDWDIDGLNLPEDQDVEDIDEYEILFDAEPKINDTIDRLIEEAAEK